MNMKFLLFVIGIIALIAVLPRMQQDVKPITVATAQSKPAPESEQEKEFKLYVGFVSRVRNAMKNPASFQLVLANRMKPGTLCVTYRATNSFNAVVPGQAVIAGDKVAMSEQGGDFASLWNKHCAHKAGGDWTSYIRPAL